MEQCLCSEEDGEIESPQEANERIQRELALRARFWCTICQVRWLLRPSQSQCPKCRNDLEMVASPDWVH